MSAFIRSLVVIASLVVVSSASAQQTVGLFVNEPESFQGYTLFGPLGGRQVYLIDNGGHVINEWTGGGSAGAMAYLLPDGHLLRAMNVGSSVDPAFAGAQGLGGRLEEFDWDGNLVWTFDWNTDQHLQHHDFQKLPNGNVVFVAWEMKTQAELIAMGRNPIFARATIWPDTLIEVQPTFPSGGTVVWEWHLWDHLIQDFDPRLPNYGVVADHPELVDINAQSAAAEFDWTHVNGVQYNEQLDQLVMSVHRFSEFWVVDHSTTTAEAASHSGGLRGRGGDLLYRYGNPIQYDRGTMADRKLFNQHDAQWIPPGCPGEGNFLVYSNGALRVPASSSIDELTPPVNASGTYDISPGMPYGPAATTWQYFGTPPGSFLSPIISGAQRMPNGNTLICEGTKGNLFEVTPAGDIVWRYQNPVVAAGPLAQGAATGPGVAVFKIRRYAPDYPGLQGRDLTPGEPLEIFEPPNPVPDGTMGTTALKATRVDAAGTQISVTFDSTTCPATDYNLLYGSLANVRTTTIDGSNCAIGLSGTHAWSGVPPGNVFFVIVGVGEFPMYESSWGKDSFGRERHGSNASNECGVTTKSTAVTCP